MKAAEPRRRGRPSSFDRAQALDSAMRLFWQRGYEGTSMDELIRVMGLSPSSLYAAFGNKQQLYHAAIERYAAGPGSFAARVLASEPTARAGIERLLQVAAAELTKPDQPMGCMVALALTHGSADIEPLQAMMTERRVQSRRIMEERIATGVQAGELPADTNVPALARMFAALFHGMSIQARDGATREELEAVARVAMGAWPSS